MFECDGVPQWTTAALSGTIISLPRNLYVSQVGRAALGDRSLSRVRFTRPLSGRLAYAASVCPRIVAASEEPLARHPSFEGIHDVWPRFLLHDGVVNEHWDDLYERRPDFQIYVYDEAADRVLAEGNTVPVVWDGTLEPGGVDWAIPQVRSDAKPTTLCALQVMVRREAQGQGWSRVLIDGMKSLAREHELDCLIAPVRPTLKSSYPLAPIERFVEWRRDDGLLLDPWLRTHERLGAKVLGIACESMRIEGTRAKWTGWTGMAFPDDGEFVVPGALVPVHFADGRGVYVEPNVWMQHAVSH